MPPTNSRTEASQWRSDWFSLTIVLGLLLLVYYVVPIIAMIGTQSPEAISTSLQSARVRSAAGTSVIASLASTTVAAILGLPLAYWLARTQHRFTDIIAALVLLPLVLPPIVSGMVLLSVLGPNTFLGGLMTKTGFPVTRSLLGIILAQLFVASPFVVITAKAAFESVDKSLEYASRTLGKDRVTTFQRVTLPLAWPGVLAGITLAFARAMGEFGATIMLAYYPRTMPVEIWVSFTTRGLESTFPIAVVLIAVSVLALVLLNILGTIPLE